MAHLQSFPEKKFCLGADKHNWTVILSKSYNNHSLSAIMFGLAQVSIGLFTEDFSQILQITSELNYKKSSEIGIRRLSLIKHHLSTLLTMELLKMAHPEIWVRVFDQIVKEVAHDCGKNSRFPGLLTRLCMSPFAAASQDLFDCQLQRILYTTLSLL